MFCKGRQNVNTKINFSSNQRHFRSVTYLERIHILFFEGDVLVGNGPFKRVYDAG